MTSPRSIFQAEFYLSTILDPTRAELTEPDSAPPGPLAPSNRPSRQPGRR
jgi:hypothetical protein